MNTPGYITYFQISFNGILCVDSHFEQINKKTNKILRSRSVRNCSARLELVAFPLFFFTVVRTLVNVTVTYVKVETRRCIMASSNEKTEKDYAGIFPRSPIVTPNPANLRSPRYVACCASRDCIARQIT